MILLRPVYPLANLIQLIVASVPEFTILIFSIEGITDLINSPMDVSASVGAP